MVRVSVVLSLCLVALAGCATVEDQGWQPRRPLGAELPTYKPPLDPAAATQPAALDQEPTGPLTLRQALALALLHNPELAGTSWAVRMAEARRLQAGLPPNPELAFDIETLGAWSTAERTLQLGWTVLMGGKLERQKKVASLERDLAGWDYEAKRIAVFTATVKAFVGLRAAQERVAVAEQLVAISQKVLDTAVERGRSGKTAPLEAMKAKVEVGKLRLELEQARHELPAARQRLAAQWGSHLPRFAQVEGPFNDTPAIPSAEQVAALLAQNPDIARWATELQLRQAVTRLEKARAIPDPTVAGGWKRYGAEGKDGWVAGAAIPLPIFDRNQGGIREAEYGIAQGREGQRAAVARAHADLAEAYQALATAHAKATILRQDVLPEAQRAFEASTAGYQQGKFTYLDTLDAQRTLFEAKLQHITVLADYFTASANVEALIGQSLDAVPARTTSTQPAHPQEN